MRKRSKPLIEDAYKTLNAKAYLNKGIWWHEPSVHYLVVMEIKLCFLGCYHNIWLCAPTLIEIILLAEVSFGRVGHQR